MDNGNMHLYQELLECTSKQRQIMDDLSINLEKEGDILPFFLEYFEYWDRITEAIGNSKPEERIEEYESQALLNIMESINANVEHIHAQLQVKTDHTGSDLRGVRTQQKVLNAYYNLNNKDQVALYFDARK
ncbi:flagellar protein FliT [Paenibacillus chibensis]|uniref:flagellar protein FliT n=1 Tax=Paenibacillus chibensis TaxID=59846 RepID=UPI000FD6FF01|nr:flagellar protein FliT [Paenibacillus chibensis]MEC0370801.1 flagellar protein FliT [Paenibacillus chibensis]